VPAINFTDTYVKNITPAEANEGSKTPRDLCDSKITGLALRVMPTGKKIWSVRYKPLGASKLTRFPLGEYPAVSLTKARNRAEDIKSLARNGDDPGAAREAIRAERQRAETAPAFNIGMALDSFIEELKTRKATWDQDQGHLNRDVRSRWAARRLGDITKTDCAELLAEVKKRTPSGANYVRLAMIAFFNWAVEQGHIPASPMFGIPRPTKKKKGVTKRALDDAEIVVMWRAIEAANIDEGLRAAFQTLFLTGQRPSEIAKLATVEVRHLDDARKALIDFPAERMKARRPHICPLSEPAMAIIQKQLERQFEEGRIVGRNSLPDFVFESRFHSRATIARHSLSQAMRRIIDGLPDGGEDAVTVARLKGNRPTPHALRRTFVTGLSRLGISREDRKACVAHAEDDVMDESYDAYDRLHEKRMAMQVWARHIDQLLSGEVSTGAVVIPMIARR
jgi:integrase